MPNCAGKECGPDGCGKVCGNCSGGAVCDQTGKCVGKPEPKDAGTSEDTAAAADVKDTVQSDAGAGVGGGVTTTVAPKSDGGCSASRSGNNGQLALIMVLLGALAVMRRRFA